MQLDTAIKNIELLKQFENEYIYFQNDNMYYSKWYNLFYKFDPTKLIETYTTLLGANQYMIIYNSLFYLDKVKKYYKSLELGTLIQEIEENENIKMLDDSLYDEKEESTKEIRQTNEESAVIETRIEVKKMVEEVVNEVIKEAEKIVDAEVILKEKKIPRPPSYPRPTRLTAADCCNFSLKHIISKG